MSRRSRELIVRQIAQRDRHKLVDSRGVEYLYAKGLPIIRLTSKPREPER
jgi:hypothetical protein